MSQREVGRMDQHHKAHGCAVKRVYICPLCGDVQRRLTQDTAPHWIPWEDMIVDWLHVSK